MKKQMSVAILIGFSFLFMSYLIDARAEQQTGPVPPVAQPLVREGDFAVRLTEALNMGKTQSEPEAESTLTSVGIAPRNGWIANYPVTPDVLGELRDAVGEAADSGRIPIKRAEAEKTFDTLSAHLGLAVVPETQSGVAQNEPARSDQPQPSTEPPRYSEPAPNYGEYSNPDVLNNYYYDEGPPVVTYYPPPRDYYYLYAWVPYPFLYSGFFFPGYFILNDFSRFIVFNNTVVVVSNHHHDHHSGRIHRIDPRTRHTWRELGWDENSSHWRRRNASQAREGASSIYKRSLERRSSATGERERRFGGRDLPSPRPGRGSEGPRPGERYERQLPPRTRGDRSALNERRDWPGPGRTSPAERPPRRIWPEVGPRERGGMSSHPPARIGSRERFAGPPPVRSDRSSDSGRSFNNSRSFGTPFQGEVRSYRLPSAGDRGPSEGSRGRGGNQSGASRQGGTPRSGICLGGRC